MASQVGKKFTWIIKNFSSLQSEMCRSNPVLIGDCKWYLSAYPNGNNRPDNFSLYLRVDDFESLPCGWKKNVKLRLSIVNQITGEPTILNESYMLFHETSLNWGFSSILHLDELHDEKEFFFVTGELMIVAEVEVLEVIGTLVESEESEDQSETMSVVKLNDDGPESCDLPNQMQQVKEFIDVNGFQVLTSQEVSVRLIFEKHPDIAVEFRVKNKHLRTTCMQFLLSLIETLCQSLEELANEDLVEADIALTYVKDAGFKVDWLEKKLEEVKEKKEKEKSGLARLQETEETLLKLKQKCLELDTLAEEQKAELLETRTPLSFSDVV